MKYKIALYGFGSFPVVFRHLIDVSRTEKSRIEFCAILAQPNYRKVIGDVLPAADILDVYAELPRQPVGGDLSLFREYHGSVIEDLAALKRAYRRRTARWRLDRAIDVYRLYKNFLIERGATHLLLSNIETPETKIAVAVAQELDLRVMAPIDLRSLTGTYFSIDSYETPPSYAAATPETRVRAVEYIRQFREGEMPACHTPADYVAPSDDDDVLEDHLQPLLWRMRGFAESLVKRRDLFDYEEIRVSVMRNFPALRETVRGIRRWRNAKQYDVDHVDGLPERFIFFPLQYSPESSINVPAPYFVDQFRVVDALRFAMPSDCVLLVKEHPACVEMRPPKFMRRLRNVPGVVVAKATIPSIDLIRRGLLTATVTGTAAFEAFLLGRPAIALGPGLSAWALGGPCSQAYLRDDIAQAMANSPSQDFVVNQIAKLFSVRYPFFFATAHQPGEPMLRRGNIRRFWAALVDHLERERVSAVGVARSCSQAHSV